MSDPMTPALTCDDVRELAGAFVLGALEPDEAAAVRAHLASCDDAHAEIAELGSVLPALDASVTVVEPPAGLKARLMAAAAVDLEPVSAGVPEPVVASSPEMVVAAKPADAPIPFPTAASPTGAAESLALRTSPMTWALRIAAVLVIGVLAGWNVLLQGQVGSAQRYQDDVAAVIQVAAQPGSLTAVLTASNGSGPTGLAAVSAAGEVSLAMHDLAPTSGNEVYEAWAIGSDGVPVPLGGFQVGGAGTGSLAAAGAPPAPGIVLALTREPGPGATTPTLPIVSSGAATAAG